MPRREFARIGTDMPDEQSIRALDVSPQWLYDRLLLRAEMSRCGIVPNRPSLWAELAKDATEPRIRRWLKALINSGHVIVDDRYQEAFVRTYVRHDGLLGQPNVVANMCSDYQLIASDRLRIAFLNEFRRIWDLDIPRNWRGGWLLAVGVYPEPKTKDGQWPDVLPAASIDRLRKALKESGIRGPLLDAIRTGNVPPFREGSGEGLPEPLAAAQPNEPEGSTEPHAEGFTEPCSAGAIAVSAFPGPESHVPSASPEVTNHPVLSSTEPNAQDDDLPPWAARIAAGGDRR